MTGQTEWVDGTGGDQPRFNTIQGNLIHHLGLFNKQACAVFSGVSCQNIIEENIFFHGPRALFNMNDDFGGGTVIKSTSSSRPCSRRMTMGRTTAGTGSRSSP